MDKLIIPIFLEDFSGLNRISEPVRIGVPLPKGFVEDACFLKLHEETGQPLRSQVKPLALWSDRTIKWALLDFFAEIPPLSRKMYFLSKSEELRSKAARVDSLLCVKENEKGLIVETGKAGFNISIGELAPFNAVQFKDAELLDGEGSRIQLTHSKGYHSFGRVESLRIEEKGPLRSLCVLTVYSKAESISHFVVSAADSAFLPECPWFKLMCKSIIHVRLFILEAFGTLATQARSFSRIFQFYLNSAIKKLEQMQFAIHTRRSNYNASQYKLIEPNKQNKLKNRKILDQHNKLHKPAHIPRFERW